MSWLTSSKTTWKVRPPGDSTSNGPDAEDSESVELEKSNILLLGPTGSGNLWSPSFYIIVCSILNFIEIYMNLEENRAWYVQSSIYFQKVCRFSSLCRGVQIKGYWISNITKNIFAFSYLYLSFTSVYFDVISRTGKTLLAKTLARLVNVPFVIADATTLTQASLWMIILVEIIF